MPKSPTSDDEERSFSPCLSEKKLSDDEKFELIELDEKELLRNDRDGPGDLMGLQQKLSYLSKNLKPTAVFIRPPIFLSTRCCLGFWVQDFREIQPEFGTITDFDNLVSAAHRR
uniref:Glycosyl hydrolase family 13 catalytic domain-containing protein n=1 Tax=Romanomermis culicivorax TaxID=13658 RepID=A0A915K689_ROMCU